MSTILVVDDDMALCRSLELQLRIDKHETVCACDVSSGLNELEASAPDLVLLDMNLPDEKGLAALPRFLAGRSKPTVVLMTADTDNIVAVDAMRAGAFDYLRKPFKRDELYRMVQRVSAQRKIEERAVPAGSGEEGEKALPQMIGNHPRIIAIHKTIGLLARSRVTVLIQGESGTGKELAARILHEAGAAGKPFVPINCSAVVQTLLESEFFGHEKGAFTSADKLKIGKLEYAEDGTVFLDEIGDMPVDLQGKLLRVLQEEEFVRVGGLNPIPLRARIVAATNKDLNALVKEGEFRKDLYYRLAVSPLRLPPLRDRREDIPLLAGELLRRIGRRLRLPVPAFSDEAMQLLIGGEWPGNVRELENVLTRAVALSNDAVLSGEYIAQCLQAGEEADAQWAGGGATLAEAESRHIARTLAEVGWNITQAARVLEISPTTLRKKIQDYDIKRA